MIAEALCVPARPVRRQAIVGAAAHIASNIPVLADCRPDRFTMVALVEDTRGRRPLPKLARCVYGDTRRVNHMLSRRRLCAGTCCARNCV